MIQLLQSKLQMHILH